MQWIVYTLFDKNDDLLYAGITTDLVRRLYKHGQDKPWFFDVMKVRQAPALDEADARAMEYSIIAAERPRYNHNGTDLCPRCRTRERARNRTAPYCTPCQTEYQRARKIAAGWTPRRPTVVCPRCGGGKEIGPSYCRPCKAAYSKERRARGL